MTGLDMNEINRSLLGRGSVPYLGFHGNLRQSSNGVALEEC